jgi:hypothetical protein
VLEHLTLEGDLSFRRDRERLAAVDSGEEVVIARRGEPRWRLSLIDDEGPPRIPGAWSGQIDYADDWKDWNADEDLDWYGHDGAPAA